MSTTLVEIVRAAAREGARLTCSSAMTLATEAGASPEEVGQAANEAGVKLTRCQLGLFGYGRSHTPDDKRLQPAGALPQALLDRLASEETGEITCAEAWALADGFGVTRLLVGQTAECVGLRVRSCQLGCF
ncbi:MAG: hypothetical protein HPY83_06080 [Anaerolineae bacterium]|nr:hypothetical protein [Anaerolineae bacterium]